MARVLALLTLAMLPLWASAQDSDDDTGESDDTSYALGAVGASNEEGGGPGCACAPGLAVFPSASVLVLAATLARRRR